MTFHRVIQGDCLKVLPTLNEESAVVITDPPYGLDYGYASYNDSPENLAELVPAFVAAARGIADRVVVFPGVHNVQWYPKADWILSWSWRDTSHYGAAGYSMWQPILLYGKDIKGFGSVNGVLKSDSIHFPDGNGIGFLADYKGKDHPCPKPEKLMQYLVRRFTNDTDTVIDPFAGSGTTIVAAKKLGRSAIGIEIDPGYCEIARRRIADAASLFHQEPA